MPWPGLLALRNEIPTSAELSADVRVFQRQRLGRHKRPVPTFLLLLLQNMNSLVSGQGKVKIYLPPLAIFPGFRFWAEDWAE